ncbi:MAG: hypothetical protein Q7V31_03620 [Parvibaculum sp.]|uniref:hypothetical protein n=1 Tax=Parvibaculum sp. TaxID=2024848 RepID=UPI002718E43E|nr:hypothetical protein [Parvibaculum sp.]MDO8837991.1 hypothetical protein [Parvibaculum sp.]
MSEPVNSPATKSELAGALDDLLWLTLPMRETLKGDARANFMAAWKRAADMLLKGHCSAHEDAPQSDRAAAAQMFAHALAACAALGVPPRDLVPLFNQKSEEGARQQPGIALDALTLLARSALRTARLTLSAKKEDAA